VAAVPAERISQEMAFRGHRAGLGGESLGLFARVLGVLVGGCLNGFHTPVCDLADLARVVLGVRALIIGGTANGRAVATVRELR